MPRIRATTEGPDAQVAAELAVAERAVRRAVAALDGPHRAARGDYDARRAVARVRRDLGRCLDSIRSVRLIGTVDDGRDTDTPPPVPARPTGVSE